MRLSLVLATAFVLAPSGLGGTASVDDPAGDERTLLLNQVAAPAQCHHPRVDILRVEGTRNASTASFSFTVAGTDGVPTCGGVEVPGSLVRAEFTILGSSYGDTVMISGTWRERFLDSCWFWIEAKAGPCPGSAAIAGRTYAYTFPTSGTVETPEGQLTYNVGPAAGGARVWTTVAVTQVAVVIEDRAGLGLPPP